MRHLLIAPILALATLPALAQPSGREPFGDDWHFVMSPDSHDDMMLQFRQGVSAVTYPEKVSIPHDWGTDGGFDIDRPGESGKLLWWGYARYYKTLVLSNEQLRDKKFYLDIDGAMSGATVLVKDTPVATRPYGYSSFRADLTPYLHQGGNIIVIELENKPESSRWYPGGGIYRNIWLTMTDPVGIAQWGTAITTKTEGEDALVTVKTVLRNDTSRTLSGELRTTISYKGTTVAEATSSVATVTDGDTVTQVVRIPKAKRWSPDSPELYTAASTLTASNYEDSNVTAFGVRDICWKADGFYLDGKRLQINGVCLHHDAGALGARWNWTAWVRRLTMLKQMGCNAIRTAHNPPAPELLDLCDQMGFVVMDELTDTWTVPKKPNGYATIFEEWAERDLRDMIRRDRNHPSVVLWSIGNEVGEQGYPDKYHIGYTLSAICHEEDPTRPTGAGCDNPWAATQDWRNVMDVYGFNYKPYLYKEFHEANPEKPYTGSETASTISTRGFYVFPVSDDKGEGRADFQVSSFDLYAPYWSSSPDTEWRGEDENPTCAGEFVWTGFDYIGEPTPYNDDMTQLSNFHDPESLAAAKAELEAKGKIQSPARSSYFGIIDLAGFPKDRYWLYQSRWRPELPMAHILPHWNWSGREGQATNVMVYTSGDSAELFLNGKSLGTRKKGEMEYRLRWDNVVYEPGKLEVVAYKDGKVWARDEVSTTGKPEKILLEAEAIPSHSGNLWNGGPSADFGGDRFVVGAGRKPAYKLGSDPYGRDLIYVDASIADSKGQVVPTARDKVTFNVEGPAEIVATDSGDPTDLTEFGSPERAALAGLTSVILRPTGTGKVTLTATSPGLSPATLSLTIK